MNVDESARLTWCECNSYETLVKHVVAVIEKVCSENWKELLPVLRLFLQFEGRYFASFSLVQESVLRVSKTLSRVEQVRLTRP